jgi:hypothetical protein
METWKTRMRLAFPTFPQGLPQETKRKDRRVKSKAKEAVCRPQHCPEPETFTPQFLIAATPQF